MRIFAMVQLLELIRGWGGPFSMVATLCLITALVAVVGAIAALMGTIAKEIREYAGHRHELEYKRELLDSGMTVDEVERLIEIHMEEG